MAHCSFRSIRISAILRVDTLGNEIFFSTSFLRERSVFSQEKKRKCCLGPEMDYAWRPTRLHYKPNRSHSSFQVKGPQFLVH